MVYIQTLEKESCLIAGDKITRECDVYIITSGDKITGVVDVGIVKFMYLTTPKEKRGENQ